MPASYETQHQNIWTAWKTADAAATTQAQRDTAYNSYIAAVEAMVISFNHPPGKPRNRP